MPRCVEIRSYELVTGSRDAFAALMREHSLPMLARWGVDVVYCGPSGNDPNGYALIRAYNDADHLRASQDAFYGSAEWREGPREAVIALIAAMTNAVVTLNEATVEALRSDLSGAGTG